MSADEIGLIGVMGCGIGESIVAKLGGNDWLIVDSCLHPQTRRPVAEGYLVDRGVDLSSQVKLIVLSHWHDDHIQGASLLVEVCENATIAFSSALASSEFGQLLHLYGDPAYSVEPSGRGLREFHKIIEIVRRRKTHKLATRRVLSLAKADHLLYEQSGCRVWAVSPSDEAILDATAALAAATPASIRKRIAVVAESPNHNAVALLIGWENEGAGDAVAVLGSDLENCGRTGRGWNAVLECVAIQGRQASVFKIPHHGSHTGHHPIFNDTHLLKDVTSVLTTYGRGVSPLPGPTDVERIKKFSGEVFCATAPLVKKTARDKAVEKMMAEVLKSRRVLAEKYGSVTVSLGSSPCNATLEGAAVKL